MRDEFWYAEQFGLGWPRLRGTDSPKAAPAAAAPTEAAELELLTEPIPSPPPPPEGCCPDPDEWEWTNIMDTDCWFHVSTTEEIDLTTPRLRLKENGTIWELVPTALTDNDDSTTIDDPPASPKPRGLNTIATKCLFGDFNLKLKFRCPNRRSTWTQGANCGDSLKGMRNWGNSGIYLFNLYEIQILDTYNDKNPGSTNVGWAGAGLYNSNNRLALYDAGAKTCQLSITELCGAAYKFRAPDKNMVKQAVGDPPNGDASTWNDFEIGFMAPRFSQNGTKRRCATITIKLNGEALYTRLGLPSGTGAQGSTDEKRNLVDDLRYTGENWRHSRGRIVLQEHDNRVQFKDIEINTAWVPTVNGEPLPVGQFEDSWQREYDAGGTEPRLKCKDPS